MRKLFFIFSAIAVTLFSTNVSAQKYNKIMGKAIKKAIGSDLKGYQTFSYPTDNFGLITSYESSMSDANFICDMWNCIGVNTQTSTSEDWLSLNNFAGVGSGGTITLSENKKQKVAVEVLLPKIYDVVGINGGFKKDKKTEISVTIGKAYLRKLRRDPIVEYINNLDNSKALKKAFNNGNLVIVVADCVIENLSVTIKVDDEMSAAIDAKIGASGTSVASKVFEDASLSVKVERSVSGTYTFKVSHPVVFARLAKKQPSAGTLGVDKEFGDWNAVNSSTDPSKLKK